MKEFCLMLCNSCSSMQDCYLVSVLNELAGNTFMVFCGTCNNVQRYSKAPFRLGAHVQAPCPGAKMDVVQTHQCPELKMLVLNKLGKVLTIDKSATNLDWCFNSL